MIPEHLSPIQNETLYKLGQRMRTVNSRLCVGLDFNPNLYPDLTLPETAKLGFALIEATTPVTAAYKFQLAGYLAWGSAGLTLLSDLVGHCRTIRPEIPLILDGKFADIDVSLSHYAEFAFELLGVDAVTAMPYLGTDAVRPLLGYQDKLIYFVCSTSNPGSGQFQDGLTLSPLYLETAARVAGWNWAGNCGLVVGATQPQRIAAIRQTAPNLPFLMPGLGTQGATGSEFLPAALTSRPESVLVNVSRSILTAPRPDEAAREYSAQLALDRFQPRETDQRQLLAGLLRQAGCISHGQFVLASGQTSDIYLDLRRLNAYPESLSLVARALAEAVRESNPDVIAAIPTAGLPLATLVSVLLNKPLVYVRSEAKTHGTRAQVEGGVDLEGKRVVILDDVLSTGISKQPSIKALRQAGAAVVSVLVVVDRRLEESLDLDVPIRSLLKLPDIIIPSI